MFHPIENWEAIGTLCSVWKGSFHLYFPNYFVALHFHFPSSARYIIGSAIFDCLQKKGEGQDRERGGKNKQNIKKKRLFLALRVEVVPLISRYIPRPNFESGMLSVDSLYCSTNKQQAKRYKRKSFAEIFHYIKYTKRKDNSFECIY